MDGLVENIVSGVTVGITIIGKKKVKDKNKQ